MSANTSKQCITLLSFRTFGDYVLKAPFLHELYARFPGAEVTILTNRKGGEVYPLLDSRLKVISTDRDDSKAEVFKRAWRIPKADLVCALDDSRTTLLLALVARGKRKIGWVQGVSRLYGKDGYFEWTSVRPWLSFMMKFVFRPGKVRLPEDKYDGDVELELLETGSSATVEPRPLSSYRSRFAWPRAARPETPYIYCAAEAGWNARQLTEPQWRGVIAGLLEAFPKHSIFVHGSAAAEAEPGGRVFSYTQGTVQQLFEKISGADLVIAPDSFALHLASLYNVPAIGYFGPAKPHRFRPTGPGSVSLFRQPECSPCLQSRGTLPCAKGLTQCISLAQLTPRDFIAAAETALGGNLS